MKIIFLVFAVVNVIRSYAETQAEPDLAVPPEELTEDIDEESRSALGPASVPVGPGLIPFRHHNCYVCTDCRTVLANTTYKICPYSADRTKNNKCVVYSEQYRHMKKPWVIRGCASERGSCEDITRAHSSHKDIVKLNFCQECEGDRCNVNAGDRPPVTLAAFFVLVITPMLAKHMLT